MNANFRYSLDLQNLHLLPRLDLRTVKSMVLEKSCSAQVLTLALLKSLRLIPSVPTTLGNTSLLIAVFEFLVQLLLLSDLPWSLGPTRLYHSVILIVGRCTVAFWRKVMHLPRFMGRCPRESHIFTPHHFHLEATATRSGLFLILRSAESHVPQALPLCPLSFFCLRHRGYCILSVPLHERRRYLKVWLLHTTDVISWLGCGRHNCEFTLGERHFGISILDSTIAMPRLLSQTTSHALRGMSLRPQTRFPSLHFVPRHCLGLGLQPRSDLACVKP